MIVNRRILGLTGLAAGLMAAAPAFAKPKEPDSLTVTPRSPFVQWEGRTADPGDGTVRIGFPGVVLRVHVMAGKLILKTTASSDTVHLDVAIDGGAPRLVQLTKGAQDLVVFEGAVGEHTVEITRRTESWEGVWDVAGLGIDAGRFLTPAALPGRRIMLIGDSITCGAACDVALDDPRQDMTINNAHKSYGKVLAARLGAQCHLVSYGGRGVMRDWQGIRDINNAPQFYERAAPDEPSLLWNAATWVPDAIGICLGTNDFSQGIPDQNEFINTYVEFVEKIRRDAPRAHVFVINSPMLGDDGIPKRTVAGAYMDEIVRRLNSPLVTRARIGRYPGRPSNAHPIAEEHVAIAAELEPMFRAVWA